MDTKNIIELKDRNQKSVGFRNFAQLKISVTIITTITWLVFSLYWIAFQWRGYTFFQNIILLSIFFLVFSAVNAILWLYE